MLLKEKKVDPRVIRTRRDLVGSLCSLMREKSFNQISVQEITDRAIINRATFYAHFEDKYSLLEHMVQGTFQEKLDSKIGASAAFTPDNLRLLTLATCDFLKDFSDHYPPHHGGDHPPIERHIQPHIYKVLLEWIDASGVAMSTAPAAETIAMATSWTVFGSVLQWSRGRQDLSAEQLTDQIMSLMMQGLEVIL